MQSAHTMEIKSTKVSAGALPFPIFFVCAQQHPSSGGRFSIRFRPRVSRAHTASAHRAFCRIVRCMCITHMRSADVWTPWTSKPNAHPIGPLFIFFCVSAYCLFSFRCTPRMPRARPSCRFIIEKCFFIYTSARGAGLNVERSCWRG